MAGLMIAADGPLVIGAWIEIGGTIGCPAKCGGKMKIRGVTTHKARTNRSRQDRNLPATDGDTLLVGPGRRTIGLFFRPSTLSACHKNASKNPRKPSKNGANVRSRLSVAATYKLTSP